MKAGMSMRLEQLEYFVAAAELQSMTLAGNLLHTTHQNVSKAVKQLEDELNLELFNRSRQGMTLTEIGGDVYRYCKQILALQKSIYQLSKGHEQAPAVGETAHFLLTPAFYRLFSTIMEQFMEQFTRINYFPEYKEPAYVTDKLLRLDTPAQMICTMIEDQLYQQHRDHLKAVFDTYMMGQEPILLFIGNLVHLKHKKTVTMKELERIPLAVYRESLNYGNFFLDCLVRQGFKGQDVAESGTSEFCGQALENGTRATIGTAFSYNNSSALGRSAKVRMLDITPRILIDHLIFVRKDAAHVTKELARFFAQIYAGGQ